MRSFGAHQDVRAGATSPYGSDSASRPGSGSMFTALTLILLTLVVYLFSVTLPDDVRRQAIHASLAKAFLFPGNDDDRARGPQGPVRLLSPGRQALRELEAHLAVAGGRLDRDGNRLVVTLPGDALFDADDAPADRTGVLPLVERVVTGAEGHVRVEASAGAPTPGVAGYTRSLQRAVLATRALIAAAAARGAALDDGRLSAVGLGIASGRPEAPGEPGPGEVRVVLTDARDVL